MATTYEDNVLNKFDTYTYKWKVKMVNLQNISQPGIVIAESGVENEISIESLDPPNTKPSQALCSALMRGKCWL